MIKRSFRIAAQYILGSDRGTSSCPLFASVRALVAVYFGCQSELACLAAESDSVGLVRARATRRPVEAPGKIAPMRFWYERMPYLREFARSHRVLQLGVGEEERFGVALDINESVKPDVVLDLDKPPYPFPDNSFDAVYGFSVIEHLSNFFAVIEEVYRLLRPGGFLAIITPHFSNDASFIDPTHRLHLSARSFDYFIDGTPMWSSYQFYSKARFKTRHRLLMLERPWSLIPGLQHATNRYVPFYEKHLCYLIRGQGIYFELEALK